MALNTHRYRTFWPFMYPTLALCYEFISHMILMKRLHKFNKIVFPSGIFECKYAPGTLNVATSIYLYASIINVVKSALGDTFGDEILSTSPKYLLWLLPFSHVLPFMVPYFYSLLDLPHTAPYICQHSIVHLGWFMQWPYFLEWRLHIIF